MKKMIPILCLLPLSALAVEVEDIYRTETTETPYIVEVCTDRLVGGDKTGSTITGAVLGAAIGNAIGKDTEATAAGAVIGGLVGHNKSNARPHYKRVCDNITKWDSVTRRVYVHSWITFEHEGHTYRERFVK